MFSLQLMISYCINGSTEKPKKYYFIQMRKCQLFILKDCKDYIPRIRALYKAQAQFTHRCSMILTDLRAHCSPSRLRMPHPVHFQRRLLFPNKSQSWSRWQAGRSSSCHGHAMAPRTPQAIRIWLLLWHTVSSKSAIQRLQAGTTPQFEWTEIYPWIDL